MEKQYHLAQLNIARMLAPIDDPIMADFVAQLDYINAVADASPGFVWRLQTDDGNATSLRPFPDDFIIVNMSVWESIDALKAYVYNSDHLTVLRARKQWFEVPKEPMQVLWWVPADHTPDVWEAKARLEQLRRDGVSAEAFTFSKPFPPPTS
ncbi:MAG: DUF3291 domain-containing protein [Chloroflexota bacterium]